MDVHARSGRAGETHPEHWEDRVQAVNEVLLALFQRVRKAVDQEDLVDAEVRELLAVFPTAGVPAPAPPQRPGIPLTATDLLVNARGEHRVGSEIQREIRSADRVDVLCSFLKWSGFRLVREGLENLAGRGARLRVLTTCYLGITDADVLDELARLGEVRVSYDARRTRLHA